jgi:hypothetical protein
MRTRGREVALWLVGLIVAGVLAWWLVRGAGAAASRKHRAADPPDTIL